MSSRFGSRDETTAGSSSYDDEASYSYIGGQGSSFRLSDEEERQHRLSFDFREGGGKQGARPARGEHARSQTSPHRIFSAFIQRTLEASGVCGAARETSEARAVNDYKNDYVEQDDTGTPEGKKIGGDAGKLSFF